MCSLDSTGGLHRFGPGIGPALIPGTGRSVVRGCAPAGPVRQSLLMVVPEKERSIPGSLLSLDG